MPNPYVKRSVKNATKAVNMTNKQVRPVAKDTNKTRRSSKKMMRSRVA